MDVHLVRAVAALVVGLPLLAYGVHILYTGEMRVRVVRQWDSDAVRRNSVFTGERARRRGLALCALGALLASWAFYAVLNPPG